MICTLRTCTKQCRVISFIRIIERWWNSAITTQNNTSKTFQDSKINHTNVRGTSTTGKTDVIWIRMPWTELLILFCFLRQSSLQKVSPDVENWKTSPLFWVEKGLSLCLLDRVFLSLFNHSNQVVLQLDNWLYLNLQKWKLKAPFCSILTWKNRYISRVASINQNGTNRVLLICSDTTKSRWKPTWYCLWSAKLWYNAERSIFFIIPLRTLQ